MNRKNCPTCGFVNFSHDIACKKCGSELSESSARLPSKVKFGTPLYNFNGFGVDLVDYQEMHEGYFKVMKSIVLVHFAIIPLSAWIIRTGAVSSEVPGMHEEYRFEVVERTRLSPSRVLRLLLLNVVSIAPLVLMVFGGIRLMEKITPNWFFELGALMIFAAIGWLILVQRRFTHNGAQHYTWQE